MAIASIKEWFQHKDYTIGLELYLIHGKSEVLKKLLSKGATEFNRKKLESELSDLIANNNEDEVVSSITTLPKNGSFPEPIDNIIEARKKLYARANYLHAQLSLVDPDTRKEFAFELLDIWDEIDTGWKIQDVFTNKGIIPNDKQEIKTADAPIELMRQLNNCRSNITKAKAKLKKAIESGKESQVKLKQTLLNHHLATKEEIETKLKQFNA